MKNLPDHLKAEWHPTRNTVDMNTIAPSSDIKIWWKAACGHEWETAVRNRYLGKGSGCAVCAGKLVIEGVNDLASHHPQIAAEWHPTLNGQLTPTQITPRSNKKAWWQCSLGHEWESPLNNRVGLGRGCPVCANQKVLKGFNDFESRYPEIAAQWHPTLNGELTPDAVFPRSTKEVYWLCNEGHTFINKIQNQANAPACKICNGHELVQGITDLATTHPQLAALWHPTKNSPLEPTMVTAKHWGKVYWLCENGHERYRAPEREVSRKPRCVECPKKVVLKVKPNNIAITHPELVKQWHPTLNGDKKPEHVTAGVNKKIFWLCNIGHVWDSGVNSRSKGSNCPICHGLKVLPGFNDLETLHPKIAADWHSTLNTTLLPSMVAAGTHQKFWWICSKNNHIWEATVKDRVRGTGCPKCATTISRQEQEMADYLRAYYPNLTIQNSNRKVISPLELDIYIPERKIAIEFNGLYWHDERSKGKGYHHKKWLECKNKGIQLIQIWEDDWNKRKDIVLNSLTRKIGDDNSTTKTYARNTVVVQLDTKKARDFMNNNHIQGFASGTYYYGLQDKNLQLKAVLILRKEGNDTYNIIRYATSENIPGGFTKLLSYSTKTLKAHKYVTFADHVISNGALYINNGFTAVAEIKPDYMYVVNDERKHKFGYRIKKFKNDPNLSYDPTMTEKQLAELNNIPRIWDAGKTRYEKIVT